MYRTNLRTPLRYTFPPQFSHQHPPQVYNILGSSFPNKHLIYQNFLPNFGNVDYYRAMQDSGHNKQLMQQAWDISHRERFNKSRVPMNTMFAVSPEGMDHLMDEWNKMQGSLNTSGIPHTIWIPPYLQNDIHQLNIYRSGQILGPLPGVRSITLDPKQSQNSTDLLVGNNDNILPAHLAGYQHSGMPNYGDLPQFAPLWYPPSSS